MHMLDLGITKYLLEFTREYLQSKVSNKAVKEMDHRLCAIPRYPSLIVIKNGLENVSKFTANDYRNIMKVMIFVIDNYTEITRKEEYHAKDYVKLSYLFNDVYEDASEIIYRYGFGRIPGK